MTILEAINDPALFGRWFSGETWQAWRAFLGALFGLSADGKIFTRHTGRSVLPQEAAKEAWLVVGRRGGKSLIAALVAVYLASFRDYRAGLGPGEVATIMLIAADRRQARVVMRYIAGFLDGVPMLASMVSNQTKEAIEFSNRVTIEVHTCSYRTTRGYTLAAVVCDEIAFWRSEESANPDREIIAALRPGLSTIPGALLLCISSPYARRGALWETYQKHFAKENDPILVWQADSLSMNPCLDPAVVERAILEDEASADAEFGAQFRRDIETFISGEAVEACVVPGRRELPCNGAMRYFGFVDPSGGSVDAMTIAVAHRNGDGRLVLNCIRERRPPFSPEAVVTEFVETLRSYRIGTVHGDRYAGEWPREQFGKHGIKYSPSEQAKSELYRDLLPLVNSGRVELLDEPRLLAQLRGLERRTGRGGKDSIDHGPGAHDDLINAAAGALVLAGSGFARQPGDFGWS